jgi:hypothetical protein
VSFGPLALILDLIDGFLYSKMSKSSQNKKDKNIRSLS